LHIQSVNFLYSQKHNSIMNFNCTNLLKLRTRSGYSQEYIADLLGIDHSCYNRLENNKRRLRIEDIPVLARAFGKSEPEILEELMGWIPAAPAPIPPAAEMTETLFLRVIREKDKVIEEKNRTIEFLSRMVQAPLPP